jgi:hypothetical protein
MEHSQREEADPDDAAECADGAGKIGVDLEELG